MIIPMNKIATFLFSAIFIAVFLGALPADVDARGGKGGGHRGGGGMKGNTRTSVNRGGGNRAGKSHRTNKPTQTGGQKPDKSVDRKNTNIDNRNRNINIDNSKHVDVDVDRRGGGYYRGGRYYNPVGTAVAIGVTAAIIGSIVYSLPPSCSTIIVNGISYSQCGNDWYEPRYSGGSVTYVVVTNPN